MQWDDRPIHDANVIEEESAPLVGQVEVGQAEVGQAEPYSAPAVQAGFRCAQQQADEAQHQAANAGVPGGFSRCRPAPAVPVLEGAR